jgi:hypothetical protein
VQLGRLLDRPLWRRHHVRQAGKLLPWLVKMPYPLAIGGFTVWVPFYAPRLWLKERL